MYKIRPYLIQEIHEGIVVQNGISTTAITSERVIEFLKEIERQNYITIEDALLIDFFGNDCEEVISFLISNEIIEHIEEISYNYKYIKILTNSQEFSEVVEFCKSDFDEKIIVYSINELDKCLEKITKDDMILVYMNPFNMEKYIEISDLLIEKDIIIITNKELFINATRSNYQFPFRGMINVIDLWDLSLTNLNSVFKTLNAEAKKSEEESLLNTKSKEDEEVSNKIEIVKYIVSVKLDEKKKREDAKKNAEMRQRLLEIKAKRQDAALENMSDEDLDKALAELSE